MYSTLLIVLIDVGGQEEALAALRAAPRQHAGVPRGVLNLILSLVVVVLVLSLSLLWFALVLLILMLVVVLLLLCDMVSVLYVMSYDIMYHNIM